MSDSLFKVSKPPEAIVEVLEDRVDALRVVALLDAIPLNQTRTLAVADNFVLEITESQSSVPRIPRLFRVNRSSTYLATVVFVGEHGPGFHNI